MSRRYALSLAALGAGALLPVALAPFHVWPLLLVSAGMLFWLLRTTETAGGAFWRGWLYGVGKYGAGASWVYVSIHEYGHTAPWLAFVLVAIFVAGMAVFNGGLGWLFHRLDQAQNSPIGTALAFAVLWTALEWLLTWFLTGFPWLFAGYAFMDTPLAGLAPVGGVLLVSFAAVLTATATVAAWRRPWMVAVPLMVWATAWGLDRVTWTQPGETRRVALVQGNVPQGTKWTPDGLRLSRLRYGELTRAAGGVDIVVWPEAAIPGYLGRGGTASFIAEQRGESGDIVTGVFAAGPGRESAAPVYYNAAYATGGDAVYRKRHLVPFGDYLPLESMLRGLIAFFDLPMSATTPGTREQPLLRAAGIDLAMAICWEVAYPATVARDARHAHALATISNDTWFGASIGPPQHLQIARMRALENGKYLLRATNDGITAIVDDRGVVVERLPRFEAGVLTGIIHVVSGATPYSRWLHRPLWLVLGVCAIAAAALRGRSPRRH